MSVVTMAMMPLKHVRRGKVREVHDAVDPRRPVGLVDLVVPDRQPRVLVGHASCPPRPRTVRHHVYFFSHFMGAK